MKAARAEVGKVRREQIIEAAMTIIAEEGLPRLSLSAIEKRAGMSRGQLTYYFPTKEDILLAVFDRLLRMMHDRSRTQGEGPCAIPGQGWDRLQGFLEVFLLRPPPAALFHALQYTFLSQMSHRDDFRQRLADLYEQWRGHMAGDVAGELAKHGQGSASPRAFATLVQAILHGLAMQRVADPSAYDPREMLDLCRDLLGNYLRPPTSSNGNAPAAQGRRRRPPTPQTVSHEHCQ
jgi:AcrR family transcriptional regulator